MVLRVEILNIYESRQGTLEQVCTKCWQTLLSAYLPCIGQLIDQIKQVNSLISYIALQQIDHLAEQFKYVELLQVLTLDGVCRPELLRYGLTPLRQGLLSFLCLENLLYFFQGLFFCSFYSLVFYYFQTCSSNYLLQTCYNYISSSYSNFQLCQRLLFYIYLFSTYLESRIPFFPSLFFIRLFSPWFQNCESDSPSIMVGFLRTDYCSDYRLAGIFQDFGLALLYYVFNLLLCSQFVYLFKCSVLLTCSSTSYLAQSLARQVESV